jgi:hypothetical protein
LLTELQPRAMETVPDGIGAQVARGCDLLIPKSGELAHQKDIAVEYGQRLQRFVDREFDMLRCGARGFAD